MATFLPRLRIIGPYRPQETFQTPSAQSAAGGDSSFLGGAGGSAGSFYKRWERLQRMSQRMGPHADPRDLARETGGNTSDRDRAIQAASEDDGSGLDRLEQAGSHVFVSQADLAEEAAWEAENQAEENAQIAASQAAANPPRAYLTQRELNARRRRF